MEPITFKNSPLHHNDMVVRANRQEVIEDLFPEAAELIGQTDRDLSIRLGVEAVIHYRHQIIRVVHHEVGEEHPALTFTVSNGIAPRSYDTLSSALQYIDAFVDSATDLRRAITSNR